MVAFNATPGSGNDGCFVDPSLHNFTSSIVLVSDANCPVATKTSALGWAGGTKVIVYTDDYPLSMFYNSTGDGKLAFISRQSGLALLDAIQAGSNVTADFADNTKTLAFGPNKLNGGVPNYFTSQGPTNDLHIKPDIAAPGGDIFSTWPTNSWATLSGTSMATPYIAGVAALYIGKHGGRSIHGRDFAKNLAMRIMASGKPVKLDDGNLDGVKYPFNAPVFQVGTGLVDAVKVLDYQTSLSFAKFALNDTHNFVRSHSVDVTNSGPRPVTYTFSVQAGGAINAFVQNPSQAADPVIGFDSQTFTSPYHAEPQVKFPSGAFSVGPGQTKTAKIDFSYPLGLDASHLPLYSGNIIISGSNGENLAVPYLGLGADFNTDAKSIFYYARGYPAITSGYRIKKSIDQKPSWTFNGAFFVQDYPTAYLAFNLPTTEFRWDVFADTWTEADWTYPPVVGKKGFLGPATIYQGTLALNGSANPDDFDTTPFPDVPRTAGPDFYSFSWLGGVFNGSSSGSKLSPGKYKLRIAALFPFSTDPKKSGNWDVISTPEIEVLAMPEE
jgi:hypothetical protein